MLQSVEARDDLLRQLEEEFDRELLEIAMLRVAQRVETHTWRAFQLTALENVSGADAAAALDVPIGMVLRDAVRKKRTGLEYETSVHDAQAAHYRLVVRWFVIKVRSAELFFGHIGRPTQIRDAVVMLRPMDFDYLF